MSVGSSDLDSSVPPRPEWRLDVLTGRSVIVAPARRERPSAVLPDPPLLRSDDPFAEGCESETPAERLAVRHPDTPPNGPGWLLRVVPNRYPAFTPEPAPAIAPAADSASPWFPREPAAGEHEVVIECPDGRSRLAELTINEISRILLAWQHRIRHLSADPSVRSMCVFRNEGFSAGASLSHCHSQIIASRRLTDADTRQLERESAHKARGGTSLLHDLTDAERAAGLRIVRICGSCVVLCPFASRASWQLRIVPQRHLPDAFPELPQEAVFEIAHVIRDLLRTLQLALGGPFSFNLLLGLCGPAGALAGPWRLDLVPRTGRIAGWELMSDGDIITVAPEQAAAILRSLETGTAGHD